MTTKPVFTDGQYSHDVVQRCAVEGGDLSRARVIVDAACTPATSGDLIDSLLALKVMTVRRNESDDDVGLQVRIYADALGRYPADVAKEAVNGWGSKWWPALVELTNRADRLFAKRNALRGAL